MKKAALVACAILVVGSLSFAGDKTFVGVVSDSHCGMKHTAAGNEQCIEHCVSGGASYVLISKGKIFQVDNQDKFKGLGGKNVEVRGNAKGDSIVVTGVKEKS